MATTPGFAFGSSSSGGSGFNFPDTNALYKKHKSTKTSTKPHHAHGLFGLVENLVGDVKDAAVGLPAGLVMMFKDPIKTAKAVAGTTWHTWSPLFEGHIGKFGHQFYDHPLAPLLDIASVFTGGAGSVARVGEALAEGGAIARIAGHGATGLIDSESRLAKLSRTEKITYGRFGLNKDTMKWERTGADGTGAIPEYSKMTSKNPVVRKFQLKRDELLNTIAGENPKWGFTPDSRIIGANKRYRRRELVKTWHKHAAMTTQIAAMMNAARTLADTGPEGIAAKANILRAAHTNMLRHAEHIDGGARLKFGKDKAGQYTYVKAAQFVKQLDPEHLKATSRVPFEENIGNIGNHFTTRNVEQAARSAEGHLLVVPKHTAHMLGIEGKNSSLALKLIYNKPTTVWKYAVLAARPAFFVNNAVGNYFMYMMAHGGTHAARGYVDALRQVHGDFKVAKDMSKTERWFKNMTDPKGHGWMDRNFLDQLTNSFADSVLGLPETAGKLDRMGGKLRGKLKYGLYPITHAVSDRFLRRAAINSLMRDAREVRVRMAKGMDYNQAAHEALLETPGLRDRVSEKVNDTLGDYHTLSAGERHIRQVIPFYSWDRAIVRHGGTMLQEKPARVAAMTRLGEAGTQHTEDALGAIPGFLKGILPLGGKDTTVLGVPGTKGRIPVLTTQGLNPYATIGDIAGAVDTIRGGHAANPGEALGNINPLITGALGWFTGQDPITGGKIDKHGLGVFDVALNEFQGLPETRLIKQAMPEQGFGWDQIRKIVGEKEQSQYSRKGSKKMQDALYSKSWQEIVASYLGAPIKQLSPAAAHKRAGAETKAMEATF